MAARIAAAFPGRMDFADDLAELDDLAKKAAALHGVDPPLYFRVRQIKRHIMFQNPVVDFDSVLFVDMPLPLGPNRDHEARHRLGFMAVPGARLLRLSGLSPAGQLTQIMPAAPLHGSFWRPDVSYNGKKILFCFKPHNEKSFHLYEINADGTGLVQLTRGPYDDLDPIYLPDGTQVSTLWGNQSVWPDVLKDARSIPGSRRILFTGCGHHRWWMGSLGIIDPDQGYNFPYGLTKITTDVDWPESGNGPPHPVESSDYHAAGQYAAYHSLTGVTFPA